MKNMLMIAAPFAAKRLKIQDIRRRLAERIAQQNHADALQARRAEGLLLDAERPCRADMPPWTMEGARVMDWDDASGWWKA